MLHDAHLKPRTWVNDRGPACGAREAQQAAHAGPPAASARSDGLKLEAPDDDAIKLLSDSWSLVTNLNVVAGKAAKFGVAVVTPIELAKLISDSLL